MSIRAIERSDICAVVVTYFPKAGCAENLAALAPQVGKLVIVDNGSSAQSLEPIEAAARELDATVVHLCANLGIAAALNAGLKFAAERGYRWLATFDQDSRATPGMLAEMAGVLASYPHADRVAVLSPCHVDRGLGFTVRERSSEATGSGWRVVTSVMTSGNLVSLEAAAAVGGFDDSLFIDYVDHDFCLRLRRHGYQILEATRATLLHSLGAMERRRFLFVRVHVTNHPVVRRYYMSRNRLIVWRRYWRAEPRWVLRDVRHFLFEAAYVLLYEKQTGAKIAAIVRGLHDGLRNIRGAFREASG
jgi:rhamnosyltransferase